MRHAGWIAREFQEARERIENGPAWVRAAVPFDYSARRQIQTCPTAQPAQPTATAAPVVQPRITAPNTGDGGLVGGRDDASWALFAAVGAVAFAVAGFATLQFTRRR